MKKAVIGIIGVLVLAIGAYALFGMKDDSSSSSVGTDSDMTVQEDMSTVAPDPAADSAVITYTDSGFNPETLTVKTGTVVTVKNDTSRTLDFASDDHPTHRINSELNVGEIDSGESATFTAKAGTWGFHDHLNDDATGVLTVED